MKIACYCVICNTYINDFYPSVARKVCSKQCFRKLTSQHSKGINNANYKHW